MRVDYFYNDEYFEPDREETSAEQKLGVIIEYLNDQKILMEAILEKLNVERKNTDCLENRVSELENKVIKTEADNDAQMCAIEALEASTNERLSEELMLDTLGMRINEEGDLVWLGQNEWIPLNKK